MSTYCATWEEGAMAGVEEGGGKSCIPMSKLQISVCLEWGQRDCTGTSGDNPTLEGRDYGTIRLWEEEETIRRGIVRAGYGT